MLLSLLVELKRAREFGFQTRTPFPEGLARTVESWTEKVYA